VVTGRIATPQVLSATLAAKVLNLQCQHFQWPIGTNLYDLQFVGCQITRMAKNNYVIGASANLVSIDRKVIGAINDGVALLKPIVVR
jgi:hypothetical protein